MGDKGIWGLKILRSSGVAHMSVSAFVIDKESVQ